MTLALRLAQQGKTVTLLEASPHLGGVASAWQLGDIRWDRHYHVILSSDTYLLSLLRELGLEKEISWKKVLTGFFIDSQLHSLSNALEFLRFPPLTLPEKLRLAATILWASHIPPNVEKLDKIPVEEWLSFWSGKGVTQKIWLPLLRAKLGDGYRGTSATFIWATIARMYAARKSGAKAELFGYVPGGYARILHEFEKLLSRSRVCFRLGQPVREIQKTCSGELRVELGSGNFENFLNVVVTAAAPLAADICPSLQEAEKRRLRDIKCQGLICASLLLRYPLSPFYITNIADSRMPFTAVIEMSALVDRRQFGGRSLVYLPQYASPDSLELALPEAEIRETFLRALEEMHPKFNRKDVECFQVSRVKYLFPIPTINSSTNRLPFSTSIPGLYLVNSSQILDGTLNVNETVRLAESAARRFAEPSPAEQLAPGLPPHELVATHS